MNQLSFLFGNTLATSEPEGDEVRVIGDRVVVRTREGGGGEMPLAQLLGCIGGPPPPGPVCWPDGVRQVLYQWPMCVVILELSPAVRTVKWISDSSPVPWGAGCKFDVRRLSFPYVILFATIAFHPGVTGDGVKGGLRLTQRCEVYFRREPMKSLDDDSQVLFPTLYNASKYITHDGSFYAQGKNGSWLCSNKLSLKNHDHKPQNTRLRDSLTALVSFLWGSGFTKSDGTNNPAAAAGNEETSWFEYSVRRKIDRRMSTVQRWEEETEKDPMFILDVPFIPAVSADGKAMSVRRVAERILHEFNAPPPAIRSSEDIARLVLNGPAQDYSPVFPYPLWPTPT